MKQVHDKAKRHFLFIYCMKYISFTVGKATINENNFSLTVALHTINENSFIYGRHTYHTIYEQFGAYRELFSSMGLFFHIFATNRLVKMTTSIYMYVCIPTVRLDKLSPYFYFYFLSREASNCLKNP
jgi:hypothetical protein